MGCGDKRTGGREIKKTGGGEKTDRRRRSRVMLEVQSDLVIHWLFRALTAYTSWSHIVLSGLSFCHSICLKH